MDKGLFKWDFGEGLSEVVFEYSPERSGEENKADIFQQRTETEELPPVQ